MKNNFKFAFDRQVKTLIDLRTDEDRCYYDACVACKHYNEIDKFLGSEWLEPEDESKLDMISSLEEEINNDLYHFEYDRPNTTRWRPLAARGKGAIVEVLYYCYDDDNSRKPCYLVIKKIQQVPYIPVAERTKVVLCFWEKGDNESSNFEIGINSQMPIETQVLSYVKKHFKRFKDDYFRYTHIDVCDENKEKILTIKPYHNEFYDKYLKSYSKNGEFYISQIY